MSKLLNFVQKLASYTLLVYEGVFTWKTIVIIRADAARVKL